MCKFCEVNQYIEQNYPDEELNHYDSAGYFLYARNFLHITSQYVNQREKNGDKKLCRRYPIFNIEVKYCPMCGKKLIHFDDEDKFDSKYDI